ncbi:hypothetical protein ACP4OV_003405 [Aristida adscensionis]
MASKAEAATKKKTTTTKFNADGLRRSWIARALLVAFVMTAPLLVLVFAGSVGSPAVWVKTAVAGFGQGSGDDGCFQRRPARSHDRLLGGLLADGFDEGSCHSRYESATYRRNAGRRPSPYLVAKLRRQEALQRRCGPGTAAYSDALEQLRSGEKKPQGGGGGSPECKYLVSISYSGLGNRILAAASAFLYAMLTGRVLLVDPSNGMADLFCEPFPGTTWLLPPASFPLSGYTDFNVSTAESWGNMVKNNKVVFVRDDTTGGGGGDDVSAAAAAETPAFAYVHLDHDYTGDDKSFFCDEEQRLLGRVPWLVMRTDSYVVPGLFLPAVAFAEELGRLFPERDAVFHHLGRYLFHPANRVWGLVTRYFDAYLAPAERRVGVQVRVFGGQPDSPELLRRITSCTQNQSGLLPAVLPDDDSPAAPGRRRKKKKKQSIAVLVTSLKPWYYEQMKSMYWEHAAGEEAAAAAVSVHQPSHEEFQKFGAASHEAKAWAEMYLLSLTDALVTTGWSTFGYVAQGLAGITPWVMPKPEEAAAAADESQPLCRLDVSMEPCFHAPPYYDCRSKRWSDTGKTVPQVQRCVDVGWGWKLVRP